MTQVTYSYEGGTNGSNVAAGSGAAAGDTNFDAIFNTSATNIYDNTHAAHGTLSNKIATSATSTSSYVSWTTSIGTQTTVWVRAYLYFTAAPTVQHRVVNFVGSASSRGNVLATTAGKLIFTNAGGGTVLTSAAFPTGQWFRLEAMFTGSATVGQWEYKIWNTPDSSGAPDDTQTSAANLNTGGTVDTYRFGIGSSVANAGPFWQDDVGVSTTAYLGPVVAAPVGPAVAQPGQAWLRQFHHRQALPPAAVPTVVTGPAGSPPGGVVSRRQTARGWFAALAGPGNALPGGPATGGLVLRRRPARAVIAGLAVAPLLAVPVTGGHVHQRPAAQRPRAVTAGAAGIAHLNGSPAGGLIRQRAPGQRPRAVTAGIAGAAHLNGSPPGGVVYRRRPARAGVGSSLQNAGGEAAPARPDGSPPGGIIRRRAAARAVAAHAAGVAFPNGSVPPAGVAVKRRAPARALWAGTVTRTVNGTGVTGRTQPRATVPLPRRYPARAVWQTNVTVRTVNAAPVSGAIQPRATIQPRRAPARGAWHGLAVPPRLPQPVTGGLVKRRAPARGAWGRTRPHGASAPPAAGSVQARPTVAVPRRYPARAVWAGTVTRTANAPPVLVSPGTVLAADRLAQTARAADTAAFTVATAGWVVPVIAADWAVDAATAADRAAFTVTAADSEP